MKDITRRKHKKQAQMKEAQMKQAQMKQAQMKQELLSGQSKGNGRRKRIKSRRRVIIWLQRNGAMKLTVFSLLCVFLIVTVAWRMPAVMPSSPQATPPTVNLPLTGKVIALDPGHGGKDGGAVSRDGLVEKHINLNVALYLRDYLQQGGALVVMTREDDRDLADPGARRRKTQDLHRRAQLVMDSKADVFISIHMNSVPSSRWHGAQTFYHPRQHPDSKVLATFIQEEIKLSMKNTTRDVNAIHDTYVLKTVQMPAALVEVGFLSNPAEAQLLADEQYQKKMAEAIYVGILRYVSRESLGSP